jgi:hypothetical protein
VTAPPTRSPASRRRWRAFLVLASISVGWKLLVFTLGAAVPDWVITDGLDELPAEQRRYAAQSLETARGLWDGPLERLGLVRAVRVMSVGPATTLPPDVRARVGPGEESGCAGLTARVRAYTYFAIPYSEVRTICESAFVDYRIFKRRRARPREQPRAAAP